MKQVLLCSISFGTKGFLGLMLAFCLPFAGMAQAAQRPNILIIFSDDHAQQTISAYGSKLMQTPGIDRLANEGALFQNSFVTNSICAPSRAALLTGKYGHKSGLIDNRPDRRFDGSQQQLQKLLGAAGYQTAWVGKWHLQTLPQGFDYWSILPDQGHYYNPDFINMSNDTIRQAGYVSDIITNRSLQWIRNRNTNQPFFMVIGEKATHREWLPDLQDLGAFDAKDFPMPKNFYDDYAGRRAAMEQDMTIDKTMNPEYDLKVHIDYTRNHIYNRLTAEQRKPFKAYYDRISEQYDAVKNDSVALLKWKYQRYLKDYLATAKSLDRNIGKVLQYLDSSGLAANTIVIYASDQGFYMGEHGWFDKRFMYEESLRTPLLMRYPPSIQPGTVVNKMILNIDLAPTLLQMANCQVPADLQGQSMVNLLEKKGSAKPKWRDAIFYHYYEYPEPHRVAPHFGLRNSQYKLIRFYKAFDAWELYDLKNDSLEVKNLYNDKSYGKLISKLKAELMQMAKEYGDEMAVDMMQKEATSK